MTFEQLATRLAGGLLQPVDDETLRAVIQATLPVMALGELDGIKTLPGMIDVTVDTSWPCVPTRIWICVSSMASILPPAGMDKPLPHWRIS